MATERNEARSVLWGGVVGFSLGEGEGDKLADGFDGAVVDVGVEGGEFFEESLILWGNF